MQIKIIEFTSVAVHRTGDYNVRGENGKSPDAARNLSFSSIPKIYPLLTDSVYPPVAWVAVDPVCTQVYASQLS